MLSVNYNPSVLKAQRNLSYATNSLACALERMSTGFRVNSASDDAAGLYVATGLNTQIRGLRQAQKNVSDRLSLLSIAEGSLTNMSNMLQRVRDLALQGANSIYDESARKAMQDEAEALLAEIKRVEDSTNFNGRSIFAKFITSNAIANANWKINTTNTFSKKIEASAFNEITTDNSTIMKQSSVSALSTDTVPQGYIGIYTAQDLDNIRNNLSGKYILMNDIDLSGIDWDPIGDYDEINAPDDFSKCFSGVLDGNGYTISNLKIDKQNENNIGLFGNLYGDYNNYDPQNCIGAEIKNLKLTNVNIKGGNSVGAISGRIIGKAVFSNCSVEGEISGTNYVGSLCGGGVFTAGASIVGTLYTQIDNCSTKGKIEGKNGVGGLVGLAFNGK